MSPVVTYRLFQRASPFPAKEPYSGRISGCLKTGTPWLSAISTVRSVELESISTLFGEKISANVNEVAIQRWEVAPNVYRFTLGEALTPGEYALAEVLEGGLNYFVWDFGVGGTEDSSKGKKK